MFVLAACAAQGPAAAAVSGRAYINWLLKDRLNGSANAFELSRVYLDLKEDLDRDARVRLTTDIARQNSFWNDDAGSAAGVNTEDAYIVYLKYAYFELDNLDARWVEKVRVGQQATHWIDLMQQHWKFRYVAKTLTDHYKFFNSADLGIAAFGSFPVFRLGSFDYHALLINGSGYKDPENDGRKDIALTLKTASGSLDQQGMLTAALGLAIEDLALSRPDFAGAVRKFTAMTSFAFARPAKGLVFVEYAGQMESSNGGFSVGGNYEMFSDTSVFGRIDGYRTAVDDYARNIIGVEYNWGENIRIAFDCQHEVKNRVDYNKAIALHTCVQW